MISGLTIFGIIFVSGAFISAVSVSAAEIYHVIKKQMQDRRESQEQELEQFDTIGPAMTAEDLLSDYDSADDDELRSRELLLDYYKEQ